MGLELKPAAYRYNGVRLPKLPEWNKTEYPYAALGYALLPSDTVVLTIGTSPFDMQSKIDAIVYGPYLRSDCPYNYASWTKLSEMSGIGNVNRVFWTNHDILNPDGSVYQRATTPIPVYSE